MLDDIIVCMKKLQSQIQDNTISIAEMRRYTQLVRDLGEEFSMRRGRQPRAFTHSYGCQQNVSDGEKIRGMLYEMGYTGAEKPDDADLVLYNTCAIRENAEDRIFGNVGALKHAKARNPEMVVGLCGCMVQQEHIAEKIKGSFPYVDLCFGTHALPLLPQLLYQKLTGSGRVFDVRQGDGEIVEGIPLRRDGDIKAWIPITYGCDNFCTYCVVPLVRGRERSREKEAVVAEARELVHRGYRELTLLGQNVNSYGRTLEPPVTFSELLRELCDIPGDFRIRFMTSHPKDCTPALIDTIAECDKICGHIHLPVQSGSNRVLAAMNRHYTVERYLELVRYARQRIPGVTLTSDIIVGFPGETEEDFAQTLELVKNVGYLSLFTFLYSRRVGTRAAKMDDPVPKEEKMRWFKQLLSTQATIGHSAHDALVGKTVRVLCDGPGKTGPEYLAGRSESNVIVEFAAPAEHIGRFVNVEITQALQWAVLGKMI